MTDQQPWILYGASGYTGQLIARHAVARGLRPVLAGRNAQAIGRLAAELGCAERVFSLDEPAATARHLAGAQAVLNCAGPFSRTAGPLIEACLATKANYLDITGEIDVIEAAFRSDDRARAAGIALLPAVGFDVVPTDCLAALLAARLPGAVHLELAFAFSGSMSRGTAKTMLESLPTGGRARIDGRIERVPTGWKSQKIPFRDRARWAMTIPWGDVASAYHTTGIANIEVYAAAPRSQIRLARTFRSLVKLLRFAPLAAFARRQIDRRPPGPTDDERTREGTHLWGRVTDAKGQSVSATLETLSGYELTMYTAVESVLRVQHGVPAGFLTPARAFGAEFVLQFPRTDVRFEPDATAAAGG